MSYMKYLYLLVAMANALDPDADHIVTEPSWCTDSFLRAQFSPLDANCTFIIYSEKRQNDHSDPRRNIPTIFEQSYTTILSVSTHNMSAANVAAPREKRKASKRTTDDANEAARLRPSSTREVEKARSKEVDTSKKDDPARLHKLALKGSGKLVAEFVSLRIRL